VLRFDDTNPSAEKQEYIDNIIANVRWLGHEPDAIYFSSDYFDVRSCAPLRPCPADPRRAETVPAGRRAH
jgi:hypothetical protein